MLGQVLPLVGQDWSHAGVAKLYTQISRNGYQILYLTSRAIGQSNLTRNYLFSLRQRHANAPTKDSVLSPAAASSQGLPLGPLIMSPDRLLHSFKREVIERRPQDFKIMALRQVAHLFGETSPFYAGFGNRITVC